MIDVIFILCIFTTTIIVESDIIQFIYDIYDL